MSEEQVKDAATVLYGKTTAAAPVPAARAVPTEGEPVSAADALFRTPESRTRVIASVQTQHEDELARLGIGPDRREELRAASERMLDETRLEHYGVGRAIVDAYFLQQKRAARGHEIDDAELTRRSQSAREEVFAIYGVAEGERKLALARRFVEAHPALKAMIGDTAIGSDPKIVVGLVDHVHRTGWRPKP